MSHYCRIITAFGRSAPKRTDIQIVSSGHNCVFGEDYWGFDLSLCEMNVMTDRKHLDEEHYFVWDVSLSFFRSGGIWHFE